MNRILAVSLIAFILLSFCACKGDDGATDSSLSNGTQSTPAYTQSNGTVEAPDNIEIETDGTVTVSGKVVTADSGHIIELESVTTFIISNNGLDTTYPDCKMLTVPNSEAAKLKSLNGMTVVVSGNLKSDGSAVLSLSDIAVENVIE